MEPGLKRPNLVEFRAYDALPVDNVKDELMALTFLQTERSTESCGKYDAAVFLNSNAMWHESNL